MICPSTFIKAKRMDKLKMRENPKLKLNQYIKIS